MVALDFLLVLLTSACIVYCMLLNRRIIQIQRYRTEMLKIFNEFDKSIEKAEKILSETKNITPKIDVIIKELEQQISHQTSDLDLLINKSDKMAEELETLIISGNRLLGKLRNPSKTSQVVVEEEIPQDDVTTSIDEEITNERERIKLSQQDYYEIIQEKRGNRK